jgi:hypothetical protein
MARDVSQIFEGDVKREEKRCRNDHILGCPREGSK